MPGKYNYYKSLFSERRLPLAYVDLDRFDENLRAIQARAGNMPVRVATKSLRCVALIERILATSPQFHALMAFGVREAVFLAERGLDDILVAYPAMREADTPGLFECLRNGKTITLMVDCAAHVERLEALGARENVTIPVCMDLGMASIYPGLYFGVRRSPIVTPAQALALWENIRASSHVALRGVMAYEAQIAGLRDSIPGRLVYSAIVRALKRRSRREVRARRAAVVAALREAGAELRFVNGGGTGSIESTSAERTVTEVTAGSAFFAPGLFDDYAGFRHLPAAGFAIEIVRIPEPGVYTCQSGGYVASGEAGPDKLPKPYLPEGASLIAQEGAGEVQTPIVYQGAQPLALGDPIFLRHAKAGELCERFDRLALVSKGQVVGEAPTYRGDGQCFS